MTEQNLESLSKNSLLETNKDSWMHEEVLKPAYNAGVVTPFNTVANVINGGNKSIGGGDLLPKLELSSSNSSEQFLSTDWVVKNAVTGIISAAPYVLAGKVAGIGLRSAGTVLNLEGKTAAFLASDVTAQVTGAAAYDGMRDLHEGETHRGNALAGATTMGIFAGINPLTRELGFWGKAGARLGIGALAGGTSLMVSSYESQGTLPDATKFRDTITSGAFMNLVLPFAQAKLGAVVDGIETNARGSIPLSKFINEDLAGKSSQNIDLFAKEFPLTRVKTWGGPGSKNTIALDRNLIEDLNSDNPEMQDVARGKAANYLGEQLAAKYRANHGIPEGTLTNTGIELALRQGRLQMFAKDAKGNEQQIMPEPAAIGNNGVDLHLDSDFVRVPKQGLIDLGAQTPKEVLQSWPSSKHEDGITLQPGDFVLAFTSERISLPSGPKPEWYGQPPLIADINSPSSIGRMGLEIHQTAPVLNNGTNNRITLEIVNNNPNPIKLVPGMKIASIVLKTLTGSPEGSEQKSFFHGQETPTGGKGSLVADKASVRAPADFGKAADGAIANLRTSPKTAIVDAAENRFPASDPEAATRIEALGQSSLITMSPARMGEIHDLVPVQRSAADTGTQGVEQAATANIEGAGRVLPGEAFVPIPASRPADIATAARLGTESHLMEPANFNAIHDRRPDRD